MRRQKVGGCAALAACCLLLELLTAIRRQNARDEQTKGTDMKKTSIRLPSGT